MMPVKGLHAEEVTFPRLKLPGRKGIYFSAVVLSMWDNIHGPKVLAVWTGEPESDCESEVVSVPMETVLAVANYSLNDEAGRTDKLKGIESKFYALLKYDIMAAAFIFSAEVIRGKHDVFSFILVLPYSEMSEYLPRHALCEEKIHKIMEENFLQPLLKTQGHGKGIPVKERMMKLIPEFSVSLEHFTQVMLTVRYTGLPDKILISETFLGRDLERQPDLKSFLYQAITSHLQTSGYTVVIGGDENTVNKMIRTLGLFLSQKERKMSRFVVCPSQDDATVQYETEVFLQGYIVIFITCNVKIHILETANLDGSYPLQHGEGPLPCTRGELWQNKLPCTFIHMDYKEVKVVEPAMKIPVFICRKQDPDALKTKKTSEPVSWRDLTPFEVKELSSHMVQEFFDHLRLLPAVGGVREAYISQFLRLVKLKALGLMKYIDAEPKSTMQQAQEQIVGVLTLRGTSEKPKVNAATLQLDLSIDSTGDLFVIMAAAEKNRPNTYLDILGDPQQQAEAVLKEFETF